MKRSKLVLEEFEIVDEWDDLGRHLVTWRCCACGDEVTTEGGCAPNPCVKCKEESQ